MHGKYSFIETLIERLIQQVRKHEKQVKAYDEAFTAMKTDANPERRGNGCMVYRVNGGTDAS